MGGARRDRLGGIIAVAALLAAACATSHPARPLGRGNAVGQGSLGGPIVEVDETPIPAPILIVGGGYGLTDRWDAYGHVDVTAAAYGDLHVEPGVAFHPVVREGGLVPTLTVAGSVHVLTDFGALRAGPQLTGLSAWRFGRGHMVYLGVDAGTLFGGRTRVLAGPLIGGEARAGRLGIVAELKWLSPWYDVKPLAPTWVSPGDHGYVALLVGCNVYWGDVK